MRRMLTLIMFELRKILSKKKALLFLLTLNVVPLVASIVALIVYLKFRGWGMGNLEFTFLYEVVQKLFTGHVKFFAWIAPFFLALIVGDSFCTEFNRGYMKMLLITPVNRWQVITAKTISVMLFLVIAVCLGGFFLQLDLFVAKAIGGSNSMLVEATQMQKPLFLVSTSAAFQILFVTFVGNLMLIGFFILFSLFFESAILMAFTSLSVIMALHTYYLMTTAFLHKVDKIYSQIAEWCFTHHLSDLFDLENIEKILEGKIGLLSEQIYQPLISIGGWTLFFYLLALFIFSRKQILH